MKNPTMRDIGEAVGVSAVTVSKALSGKSGVSGEMREKILNASREMGYVYPQADRQAQPGSFDVGILIPERYFEPHSFYSVMYKQLVQDLSARGHFGLLELLSPEAEKALELPNVIRSQRVQGLILLGQPAKEYYRMIARAGTPAVFLDFYDEQGSADAVVGDNSYGAYRLTSHLIKEGHTRIGFVGSWRATSSIMDRYLGFFRAMLLHDLPIVPEWILPDRGEDGVIHDLVLPATLPTAFVCNCDVTARRLIDVLNARGLKVPGDISVTGFDDHTITDGGSPALSTFRVDTKGMIALSINALCDRLRGDTRPFGRIVVPGQPIYRDSETPLAGSSS